MLIQQLKQVGLSDKQAKVYLAVLELGEASALQISRHSGVNRVTCYQALDRLAAEGLVREVKVEGKSRFVAEMPKKLLENLLDKKISTERQILALEKVLPELESLYNYSEVKPKIRFYEGVEGLKQIYQDTLEEKKEILAFTAYHRVDASLKRWLDKHYVPQRVKRNIFAKVIAPSSEFAQKFKRLDSRQNRHTLLVPADKFPFSIEVNIYGNKVAIISFVKKEMMGVIIESKEVAATFRLIFQLAWQGAEQYNS